MKCIFRIFVDNAVKSFIGTYSALSNLLDLFRSSFSAFQGENQSGEIALLNGNST